MCVSMCLSVTCVSSMHSQKCVTLLKLRTDLTIYFFFCDPYLWKEKKTLNCHHTYTVRAFDLIPTLRTRLSISYHMTYIIIKLVLNCHMNWPYTLCGRDFFNQPLLVMRSRCEPPSTTLKVVTA